MILPQIVLCRGAGTPAMLKLGGSYKDDGTSYNVLARTRPFFPAGQGGECIFTNLYVTLTGYDTLMGLGFLVYIDGVAITPDLSGRTVAVPYQKYVFAGGTANPRGVQTVRELSLLQAYPPYPAAEKMRVAPRGGSIVVEVGTEFAGGGGNPARIVIDGIEVEYEIVRESKQASTASNVG